MKTFRLISSGLCVASRWTSGKGIRNLRQVSVRHIPRIFLLGMIFILNSIDVPGGSPAMTEELRYQAERSLFYFQIRHEPFSEELLKRCLEIEKIKYQDVVILQSRLETGYYTSDVFLNGNNLFGMKYPSQRPTVATGTYKGHASYSHWSDSVVDYALWQQWYISLGYRIGAEEDNDLYLVFLKCIPYAEDRRYVPKLVKLSQGDMA